jgi:hypothetical protein
MTAMVVDPSGNIVGIARDPNYVEVGARKQLNWAYARN